MDFDHSPIRSSSPMEGDTIPNGFLSNSSSLLAPFPSAELSSCGNVYVDMEADYEGTEDVENKEMSGIAFIDRCGKYENETAHGLAINSVTFVPNNEVEIETEYTEDGHVIPSYDVEQCNFIAEIGEEINTGTAVSKGPSCFNCGGQHRLMDCLEERDENTINKNRKKLRRNSSAPGRRTFRSGRYHLDLQQKYDMLEPGTLSEEIQSALGLRSGQLPRYIYKMRKFGYPPGWKAFALEESSCLKVYGRKILPNPLSNRCPKLIPNRVFTFAGFNAPVPQGFHEEGQRHGVRHYEPKHSRERFINEGILQEERGMSDDISQHEFPTPCNYSGFDRASGSTGSNQRSPPFRRKQEMEGNVWYPEERHETRNPISPERRETRENYSHRGREENPRGFYDDDSSRVRYQRGYSSHQHWDDRSGRHQSRPAERYENRDERINNSRYGLLNNDYQGYHRNAKRTLEETTEDYHIIRNRNVRDFEYTQRYKNPRIETVPGVEKKRDYGKGTDDCTILEDSREETHSRFGAYRKSGGASGSKIRIRTPSPSILASHGPYDVHLPQFLPKDGKPGLVDLSSLQKNSNDGDSSEIEIVQSSSDNHSMTLLSRDSDDDEVQILEIVCPKKNITDVLGGRNFSSSIPSSPMILSDIGSSEALREIPKNSDAVVLEESIEHSDPDVPSEFVEAITENADAVFLEESIEHSDPDVPSEFVEEITENADAVFLEESIEHSDPDVISEFVEEITENADAEVSFVSLQETTENSGSKVSAISLEEIPEHSGGSVSVVSLKDITENSSTDVSDVSVEEIPENSVAEVSCICLQESTESSDSEVSAGSFEQIPENSAGEVYAVSLEEIPKKSVGDVAALSFKDISENSSTDVSDVSVEEIPGNSVAEVSCVSLQESTESSDSEESCISLRESTDSSDSEVSAGSLEIPVNSCGKVSALPLDEFANNSGGDVFALSFKEIPVNSSAVFSVVSAEKIPGNSFAEVLCLSLQESTESLHSEESCICLRESTDSSDCEVSAGPVEEIPVNSGGKLSALSLEEIPKNSGCDVSVLSFKEILENSSTDVSDVSAEEIPGNSSAEVSCITLQESTESSDSEESCISLRESTDSSDSEESCISLRESTDSSDSEPSAGSLEEITENSVSDASAVSLEKIFKNSGGEVCAVHLKETTKNSRADVSNVSVEGISENSSDEASCASLKNGTENSLAEVSVASLEISENSGAQASVASLKEITENSYSDVSCISHEDITDNESKDVSGVSRKDTTENAGADVSSVSLEDITEESVADVSAVSSEEIPENSGAEVFSAFLDNITANSFSELSSEDITEDSFSGVSCVSLKEIIEDSGTDVAITSLSSERNRPQKTKRMDDDPPALLQNKRIRFDMDFKKGIENNLEVEESKSSLEIGTESPDSKNSICVQNAASTLKKLEVTENEVIVNDEVPLDIVEMDVDLNDENNTVVDSEKETIVESEIVDAERIILSGNVSYGPPAEFFEKSDATIAVEENDLYVSETADVCSGIQVDDKREGPENVGNRQEILDSIGIKRGVSGSIGIKQNVSNSIGIKQDTSDSIGIKQDPSNSIIIKQDVSDSIDMKQDASDSIDIKQKASDTIGIKQGVWKGNPEKSNAIVAVEENSDFLSENPQVCLKIQVDDEREVPENVGIQPDVSDSIGIKQDVSDSIGIKQGVCNGNFEEVKVAKELEIYQNPYKEKPCMGNFAKGMPELQLFSEAPADVQGRFRKVLAIIRKRKGN